MSDPQTSTPRWRPLLAAVCVAQATAIVGFDFTLPFVPLYLQRDLGIHGLGQTALWAGLIGFGPAIPATIFGPIWGRLADRFGYRAMLLRAMVCSSILLAFMGLAPTAPILLALRMVQGALSGTVFSAQALVASAVPERETGRAMGLLQMSVFMGATLGPVGGGAVADLLGYRSSYAAAGVLLAFATVVVFLFVREPRREARHAVEEARPPVLSLFSAPAFVAALTLTLGVQLAGTCLFPIIPLYVQDLLHSSRDVASDAGWLMALTGLAGGAGSYLAGRLQRPLGLRRLLAITLVLSAALLAPQALAGGFTALLVTRTLFGVAFGALIGLVGTLSAVSSPRQAKGTAFGLVGAASSLGFGSGPLMGGALVAAIGLRPLFVVAAALLLVAPAALFGLATGVTSLLRAFSLVPRWEAEQEQG